MLVSSCCKILSLLFPFFLTKQISSSSWNSMLTIPVTFFLACILFQNLPHVYFWLLYTIFLYIYSSESCTYFPPWKDHLSFPCPPRLLCSLFKDSVLSSPLNQLEVPESCFFSNHLPLPQCHPVLSSPCIYVFPPFPPSCYDAPAFPFTVQPCFSHS